MLVWISIGKLFLWKIREIKTLVYLLDNLKVFPRLHELFLLYPFLKNSWNHNWHFLVMQKVFSRIFMSWFFILKNSWNHNYYRFIWQFAPSVFANFFSWYIRKWWNTSLMIIILIIKNICVSPLSHLLLLNGWADFDETLNA